MRLRGVVQRTRIEWARRVYIGEGVRVQSEGNVVRRYRSLIPFALLLGLWVWVLPAIGSFKDGPNGRNFGVDFAILISGSTVLQHGEDPYAPGALLHAETWYLRHQGLPAEALPRNDASTRATSWTAYPPIVLWALSPLSGMPFQALAIAWIIAMTLACAGGFFAITGALGWKRYLLPCLVFLALPETLMGLYLGNISSSLR